MSHSLSSFLISCNLQRKLGRQEGALSWELVLILANSSTARLADLGQTLSLLTLLPHGGRRQGQGHCWTWRDGPCLPSAGPLHRCLGLEHPGGPEVSLSDLRLSLQGSVTGTCVSAGGMKQYLGAS